MSVLPHGMQMKEGVAPPSTSRSSDANAHQQRGPVREPAFSARSGQAFGSTAGTRANPPRFAAKRTKPQLSIVLTGLKLSLRFGIVRPRPMKR